MAGSLVSPTGSHLSIKSFSPSPDGRYIAYGLAAGGAEMPTLHILNVATGKDLPETAERAGFPGAQFWRADGSAFYYARLQRLEPGMPPTATYQNSSVFLHVVGSPFDSDRSVLGTGVTGSIRLRAVEFPLVATVRSSHYALALAQFGTGTQLRVYAAPEAEVAQGRAAWRPI